MKSPGRAPTTGQQAIPRRASAAAMFAEAVGHHQSLRLPQAERLYRRILAADPKHADSLHLLGLLACQVGRHADGIELIGEAISLKDHDPVAHNNLGNALQKLGRAEEALAHFQRALALKLDIAEVHNNLGNALKELGRPAEAVAHFRRALALKPGVAEVHNNLGNALRAEDKVAEAIAQYRHAIALKPGYADAHNNLGNALRDLGKLAEAKAQYQRAIALKPDFAGAYHNLGNVGLDVGDFDAAQAAYERAIALEPKTARFYRPLVAMERVLPGDDHLAAMEALVRDLESMPASDQRELHFALGKAYESLGEYHRSFQHLLAGNAIKRSQIDYDEAQALGRFERLRAVFTPALLRRLNGLSDCSAAPIFIVGMPRSGTTLVEQILASHPAVFGAGELSDFDQAVTSVAPPDASPEFPEAVAGWSAETLRQIGARYLASTGALAPAGQRITDKMPGNFRYAGLIHLALPHARIIHLRRDPIDTCLSCFALWFEAGHPYSYDLQELGRYYRGYEALMQHWRDVLPPDAMLEVQYEAVVADLGQQARRIVTYCGLEWDDACLDFHKTQRPVRTASAVQVRQPIYRSSVGRWRAYGDLLQPLIETLGPRPA